MSKNILVLSLFTYFTLSQSTIIEINDGALLGKSFTSLNGRSYQGFRRIPYAQPPIGPLRFQLAQPPEPWNHILNATEPSPLCIQNMHVDANNIDVIGEEDCLYIDVYRPTNISKTLPVMVYIHGGGFHLGGSIFYSPHYFMDHDVIIVMIQYRLNVFGFLTTNDEVIPGNLGMKDQVTALKWVKNNIAAFGGNPDSVTLFGNSAGASAVHFHSYSPLSKGLFHRMICQSGTAFIPKIYNTAENIRKRTLFLAEMVFCPTESSRKMMECLQNVPAELLLRLHVKMFTWTLNPPAVFPVVIESKNEGAFLAEELQVPVVEVPMMLGANRREGVFLVSALVGINNGEDFEFLKKMFKQMLPRFLNYGRWIKDEEQLSQIEKSLVRHYFADSKFQMNVERFIDFYTDCVTVGVVDAASINRGSVYLYYYDHLNQQTATSFFGYRYNGTNKCVSHVDELISLFYLPLFFDKFVVEDADAYVSKRLLNYWVNFANKGNPNDENELWKPMKKDEFEYLHITTSKDEMKKGFHKQTSYELWKALNVIRPLDQKRVLTDEL